MTPSIHFRLTSTIRLKVTGADTRIPLRKTATLGCHYINRDVLWLLVTVELRWQICQLGYSECAQWMKHWECINLSEYSIVIFIYWEIRNGWNISPTNIWNKFSIKDIWNTLAARGEPVMVLHCPSYFPHPAPAFCLRTSTLVLCGVIMSS